MEAGYVLPKVTPRQLVLHIFVTKNAPQCRIVIDRKQAINAKQPPSDPAP